MRAGHAARAEIEPLLTHVSSAKPTKDKKIEQAFRQWAGARGHATSGTAHGGTDESADEVAPEPAPVLTPKGKRSVGRLGAPDLRPSDGGDGARLRQLGRGLGGQERLATVPAPVSFSDRLLSSVLRTVGAPTGSALVPRTRSIAAPTSEGVPPSAPKPCLPIPCESIAGRATRIRPCSPPSPLVPLGPNPPSTRAVLAAPLSGEVRVVCFTAAAAGALSRYAVQNELHYVKSIHKHNEAEPS